MDTAERAKAAAEAQADLLFRHAATRRASAAGANGSPAAVEATLASISAEVTEEAIVRRNKTSNE